VCLTHCSCHFLRETMQQMQEVRLPETKIAVDDTTCCLVFSHYQNPRNICISFVDESDGSVYARVTTNWTRILDKDEVYIKTWSENEGLYTLLNQAGVIGSLVRDAPPEPPVFALLKKPAQFK
jgi:hypothetical protein